jgi:hypothetical protein
VAEDEILRSYRQSSLFGGVTPSAPSGSVPQRTEPVNPVAVDDADRVVSVAHSESRAVRYRITDIFYRVAGATGAISERDFLLALGSDRGVAVHGGNLPGIVSHIDELVRLPGGVYASVAGKAKSPLVRYLRRLLSVCPGGLPVDIVSIQLVRRLPAYRELDTADLLAFAEAHPELVPSGDRIRPRPGVVFRLEDELGEHERRVHEAIRDADMPLTADQIGQFTRHRAKIPPTSLRVLLRESVVLVTCPDGRVDTLRPSTHLMRQIRANR